MLESYTIKNITTNKLQKELSKIIHEVEQGETYQVVRYTKPVAYLISENDYKRLISGQDCKKCDEEIRTSIKGLVSSVSTDENMDESIKKDN